MFPSLTGVIHFLITYHKNKYNGNNEKFPSLTGVIHFLIENTVTNNELKIVSVPYRGYSFFNENSKT